MLTLDKIIEIFCIADEFCKSFAIETIKQPKLLTENRKKHCKRTLLSAEKVHWTGFTASNCISSATTKVNCCPSALRPEILTTETLKRCYS